MKKKVVIRDCKKSDLSALQSLVKELYITDTGPRAVVPIVQLTYQALKASPKKGRLLVFECGESLVGYAIIIFFWSNEFAGDVIDVDEILVTKSSRGMGVGTSFFKWLAREYKSTATGWSLQVKPANKRAFELYESIGFRTSSNWHMYNIFAWNKAVVSGRLRSGSAIAGGGKPVDKKAVAREATKTVGKKSTGRKADKKRVK